MSKLSKLTPLISKLKPYAINICLVVIAFNTLTQLWLGKGLASKSEELDQILAQTGNVTAQTNDQLLVLSEIKKVSGELDVKMDQLQSGSRSTADRLSNLHTIIGGTLKAVNDNSTNTNFAGDQLAQINQLIAQLNLSLSQTVGINNDVINNLQTMIQLQTAATNNLKQMNQKTNFLPH
ncbi:hypothetical protein [Effusibacillus consociatus]|uniref:Uncharacterized protein n=1 Tax=Effusibacillus consociatus TaxID=1117041 RepID=A0ABV9PWU4_9BACL